MELCVLSVPVCLCDSVRLSAVYNQMHVSVCLWVSLCVQAFFKCVSVCMCLFILCFYLCWYVETQRLLRLHVRI